MNTETLHLILSAGLVAAAAALDVAANLMLARSDGLKQRLIGIAALALVDVYKRQRPPCPARSLRACRRA